MPRRASLQCPNCGNPIQAIVETVIDGGRDPEAKSRLLSGRVNAVRCPNCGAVSNMATPLLYHDASKELLLTFVPMELGLSKDQSEKQIGEMMKEVTTSLKPEQMRGYIFQPRQMLTLQGMIDTILQADGVTSEMLDDQKKRIRLVEELLNTPRDLLESRVQQIDDQIDERFMQLMTIMAQRVASEGQVQLAEALLSLQEALVAYSTYGQQMIELAGQQQQTVQAVANELNALAMANGGGVTREAFLELALTYGEDDQKLQALVGLARRAMDYGFFDLLTTRINAADEGSEEKAGLEGVRDRLLELTQVVDQQAQAAVQESAAVLQALLNAPDMDAAIAQALPMLDETFLAVLGANIQEAERRADIQAGARLKTLYERVLVALQGSMPPELAFINELLQMDTPEAARDRIQAEAANFGPVLLQMLDGVEDAMQERGEAVILQRLAFLRGEIEAIVGGAEGTEARQVQSGISRETPPPQQPQLRILRP